MEFISMLTDLSIRDSGRMTSSMGSVQNTGMTKASTWVSMWTPRKKAKENMCGQMVTSTSVSGAKMLLMGKESTNGKMAEFTVGNGWLTSCMEWEPTSGLMAGCTMVST